MDGLGLGHGNTLSYLKCIYAGTGWIYVITLTLHKHGMAFGSISIEFEGLVGPDRYGSDRLCSLGNTMRGGF